MNGQTESRCAEAKSSVYYIAALTTDDKNKILKSIADMVESSADYLIAENQKDIVACKKPPQFIDRLMLNKQRISAMAEGVRSIAALADPVGVELCEFTALAGMRVKKISVPLGVIGIIYEARPNVTVDAAALCIKSGNAVVLRGGSDAINSNRAVVRVLKEAIRAAGYEDGFLQLIEDTSHEGVKDFCKLNQYLDVLIPRGGAGLISSVVQNSTVPVIETGTGNCHVYIEKSADIDVAVNILVNAKTQRLTVCNTAESLLVDRELVGQLPIFLSALADKGVEIYGDEETVKAFPAAHAATEDDYAAEYLDLKISCKVVDGVAQAVSHINRYSTHHSEAIISTDATTIDYFTRHIDSAAVYVNASTRFTDGYEFGFGAEMGISTQKLHARGPVGLRELTSYKYVVLGSGQVRK